MKTRRLSPIWLLCIAALALRAGWVVYRWATPGPTFDYPDEDLHWQLATNLVRDGTLISDDGRFAARMPLYPLFLALFAGLGQTGILVAKLGQAALGAVTVLIVYRLASAALDSRAALVAGLLVCCDPFAIFFANLLLSEVLFTLLAVGLIACAWAVVAKPGPSWGALLGLALLGATSVLTRPSAVGLLPLLWLLALGLAGDRRRMALRLLLCPALLAALLLPWGVRNKTVLGSFAWLSTNGGVTLYDAQGSQADGSSNQLFLQEKPELRGLDEVTLDRTLTRLALAQMRRDPVNVLRLAGVKFLRTWSPVPNVAEYRHGPAAAVSAAYTVIVLTGAVIGLARWRATRAGAFQALLWLPVVYFTLLHCVYIGSVRYRVPLMPFIALAAGPACAHPINPPRP